MALFIRSGGLRHLGPAEAKRQHKANDDAEQTDQKSVFESRQRVKTADAAGPVQNGACKDLKNGNTEKRRRVEHTGLQAQNFQRRDLLDDPPQRADEPARGNAHHQQHQGKTGDPQLTEKENDSHPGQGIHGQDRDQGISFVKGKPVGQPAEKGSADDNAHGYQHVQLAGKDAFDSKDRHQKRRCPQALQGH